MRIIEVAPAGIHPNSGVVAVLVHLAGEFAARGHEVEIWQLSPWSDAMTAAWSATLDASPITMVDASRSSGFSPSRRASEIIHLHNVFSIENNRLARRLRSPFVLTPHGGYAPEQLSYHSGRKWFFKHAMELPMIRRAAAVVALTDMEQREVGLFSGRTATVIPNGVPPPPAGLSGDEFRREHRIADAPLAVYAGRSDLFHKRLEVLVQGLADAPDWHLAIVGGDFRDGHRHLSELAARLGISGRLHIVGELRGVEYLASLAAGDVFTLMSRWEGQSIALLEALALGTPAVVSGEVEVRMPVAASGAGWVSSPAAVGETLRAIQALDRDDIEAKERNAKALAQGYEWSAAADAYLRLFREILNR